MTDELKDFVFNEDSVEIDIDGLKFGYRPASGEDEDRWLNQYISIDETTKKQKIDYGQYNHCKLGNVVHVPYPPSVICAVLSKITGQKVQETEWIKYNELLRIQFLESIRSKLRNKLITEIQKIDEPDEQVKKN